MPEPVEEDGEVCQGGTECADVAGIVDVANRESDVIERRQHIAAFDFNWGQMVREVGFAVAVAAVVSDHQAPVHRLGSAVGVGVAPREAVGQQRQGKANGFWVASAISTTPSAAAIASSSRPATANDVTRSAVMCPCASRIR